MNTLVVHTSMMKVSGAKNKMDRTDSYLDMSLHPELILPHLKIEDKITALEGQEKRDFLDVVVRNMLCWQKHKRLSAKELLQHPYLKDITFLGLEIGKKSPKSPLMVVQADETIALFLYHTITKNIPASQRGFPAASSCSAQQ